MVYSDERGSSTIEGAIVFPIILLLIFSLFSLTFKIFNKFSVINSLGHALRVGSYSWYNDKKLYDDIIYDFDGTKATIKKLKQTNVLYKSILKPVYSESKASFSLSNLILYRSINGKVDNIEGKYPIYRGAMFVRGSQYAKELLEDAFSNLEENMPDSQEVYIVDDDIDEYEYDRVYHLYSDCSYLKNGYKSKTTLGEGRGMGFRVCRICLARKTGMD
ncbi:MAG: hypothetical protein PHQ32_03170 [Firmicutes bacterium]|nr:hypothetical protein [Bacillota bacterium]